MVLLHYRFPGKDLDIAPFATFCEAVNAVRRGMIQVLVVYEARPVIYFAIRLPEGSS